MLHESEKDIDFLLEQVIALHKDAVEGNANATQELHQLFEEVRSDNSGDPLLDAYHGNTKILIARDKTNPLDKLRWSKSGLKLLDGAVSAAPHNSMIRLLRGKTAYRLPEKHFHRSQTAIEDYTFIIYQEMYEEGFLDTKQYLQLIYELGEVYYRIGQNHAAAMCWNKLKNETEDTDFLHLLKLKLDALEGKPAIEYLPYTESPTTILIKRTVRAVDHEIQSWVEQPNQEDNLNHRLNKIGPR